MRSGRSAWWTACGEYWEVELVAGPGTEPTISRRQFPRWALRVARNLLTGVVFVDEHEAWAWRRFACWRPDADAALLIAWPFSPPFVAASRLRRRGIPYVTRAGDPFALTPGATAPLRGIARRRAVRLERRLWRGSAGAIVTTTAQAEALRRQVPGLAILVRPNGYTPEAWDPEGPRRPGPPDGDELRLAYFGSFQPAINVDPRWFFERLLDSGRWRSITVDQYVSDRRSDLGAGLPAAVRHRHHDALPWRRAARAAEAYDLALVIGAHRGVQLPSKAVEYQTLPIPRVAVVEEAGHDATSTHLAERPGWLIVDRLSPEVAARLAAHAADHRNASDLEPPADDAWPQVVQTVRSFIADRTGRA